MQIRLAIAYRHGACILYVPCRSSICVSPESPFQSQSIISRLGPGLPTIFYRSIYSKYVCNQNYASAYYQAVPDRPVEAGVHGGHGWWSSSKANPLQLRAIFPLFRVFLFLSHAASPIFFPALSTPVSGSHLLHARRL